MNKIIFVAAVAALTAAGTAGAHAQSSGRYVKAADLDVSLVPASAHFLGFGGSYNTMNFGNQSVYAVGTSDVFQNGVLVSSGSAAGPASIGMGSASGLAPTVQGGFFQKFAGSEWLWGAKFSYSYLNANATVRNALLPQAGSFTATGSTVPTAFTGNALVQSYQTSIEHQLSFVPFIGRAFERSFVYGGVGPTLSRTRTNLNGLIGFADITGTPSDISGAPINLSSAGWVWGGAAVIGATYFLDRSWFVDFNYSYATTANQTGNYFSPFTNPNGTNGSTIVGTLVGNSTGRVITQSVNLSINKAF